MSTLSDEVLEHFIQYPNDAKPGQLIGLLRELKERRALALLGAGPTIVLREAFQAGRDWSNGLAQPLIIKRAWAMPSMHTFTIRPIGDLVRRHVGSGKGWVDPFAGENSPAEWTNDLNPTKPTKCHMDAIEFCRQLKDEYEGALFDPPYSLRQIMECYEGIGMVVDKQWATTKFYTDVKNELAQRVRMNGLAICFGWNTIGFGKKRGFRLEEILIVCHGRLHNDTLVTVERKVHHQERLCL